MIRSPAHRSRVALAAAGAVLSALACARAGAELPPAQFAPPLSPRTANYAIEVRLGDERRLLSGRETVTWFNDSSEAVPDLAFHFYLNAFRNSESTYVRESGGRLRDDRMDMADGWGFVEVRRLTLPPRAALDAGRLERYRAGVAATPEQLGRSFPLNGEAAVELVERLEPVAPDDGNREDRTSARVTLPAPLPPGAGITLELDFEALLPSPPFARSGTEGEYVLAGQWFPKLAVHEPGRGWNAHQYHAHSEFFADFGVYEVAIDVPAEDVVGATGVEVGVERTGERAVHRYYAEDVHDFAWTASPAFEVHEGRAGDVAIRVLLQPEHAEQAARHLEAARFSIGHFERQYGDYPYRTLTVVDPRRGAGGSGGMEYPTLITGGTEFRLPEWLRIPELVIVHEFGHNFWYGLVASNEFEESWLDEGITTYAEIVAMREGWGERGNVLDGGWLSASAYDLARSKLVRNPSSDPIVRPAWGFYSGLSYSANSYARPGLMLETLRGLLGDDTMSRAMRTYFERWRFRHPKTGDFETVVEEVAGRDLGWFFDQALRSNAALDYAVTRVVAEPIEPRGFGYDRDLADPLAEPADEDEEDGEAGDGEAERWRNRVAVRRLGEFRFPVTVEIELADGTLERREWDGQEPWTEFVLEAPSEVARATVDPERRVALDRCRTNDSRSRESRPRGPLRLALEVLRLGQLLLDVVSP